MVEQAAPQQPMGTAWSRSPRADMEEPMVQQWMRPEGHSPWITTGAALGWSCSPRRAARSGGGGQGELPATGTWVEQCLTDTPHGSKPCWGRAWSAAACGKLTQDQFWIQQHPPWGKTVAMEEQQRRNIKD